LNADPEVVLEARGLTRRFGTRVAVDHVDLAVRRGEVFGCLGPNGSGKSTLMRMLLGLLEPSGGDASVLGYEIPTDAEKLRPHVGYMTQRFSLYEELTVRENLEFAAEVFGIPRSGLRDLIEATIVDYGLVDHADTRAEALSGGYKQRLSLAATTVHAPKLLVLDEPTAGVDPQSRREFWEQLFELAAAGTTLFVSTHYMDEAVRCHRLAILRDGRRVAQGRPRDLLHALAGRVIDVETERPEEAIAALRQTPLVASTTQIGDSVHVLLEADAPDAAIASEELVRDLVRAGFRGASARPGGAQLEDVFVALLHDESAGGDS